METLVQLIVHCSNEKCGMPNVVKTPSAEFLRKALPEDKPRCRRCEKRLEP